MNRLPSTLQRSRAKAKRTWAKAHDNAVEEYGEGERAHRKELAAAIARRQKSRGGTRASRAH